MSNENEDLEFAKAMAAVLLGGAKSVESDIEFMNYPDCILAISPSRWPEIVGEGKSKEDAVLKWQEAYRLYYETDPPQLTYVI